MGVLLVLVLIWAVVLVPPALRSHAAQQEAFLVSMGSEPALDERGSATVRSLRVQCRRRIAGGLLVATVVTLIVGLLPTFRVLLVVHLFLADSFIAYIALLAYWANQAALAAAPAAVDEPAPALEPDRRRWRVRARVPALAPLA